VCARAPGVVRAPTHTQTHRHSFPSPSLRVISDVTPMATQHLKSLLEKHTVADMPVPKTLIEIDSKSQLIDGFEVRVSRSRLLF